MAKRTTRVGKALQAVADFIKPAKKKSAKKKTSKQPVTKAAKKVVPGAKKKHSRRAK